MTNAIGYEPQAQRQARNLLRTSHLFKGLPEPELDRLAGLFTVVNLKTGQRLFEQGDRGDSFFFVLNGTLDVTQRRGADLKEEVLSHLTAGDFFGEGALLFGSPRRAAVTAVEDSAVLRMDRDAFDQLLLEHPEIKQELIIVSQGYDLAGRKQFTWLGDDEGLHLLARKHGMILVFSLVPVVTLLLSALSMMYWGAEIAMRPLLFGGIALLIGSIGWGIWRYIDWGDDYYIVTDKRVVWLEETLLLYESIQEAKLTEVRSVDLSTDFIQRIFGYGDLNIRTYTGTISMRDIPQPERFKALIEEYWQRAVEASRREVDEEIDQRLRLRLGMQQEVKAKRPPPASIEAQRTPGQGTVKPITRTIFTNFLKMRYLEGEMIVYRKHWFLLLAMIWQPSLGLALLLGGGTYLLVSYPSTALNMIYVVALLALTGWWIYQYWDWRDDRFELSRETITDLDRTPLGRENRQTAPLENILSLEHERLGLLGILLNFGTVSINVGDKTFVFEGVHNPARIRQEISDRQQARVKQIERDRILRDEDRQLDWLARYHRNARELWDQPEEEQLEEDGFELK